MTKNKLTTTNAKQISVKNLLSQENYKKRFQELLKDKSEAFMASVINASNSPTLKDADPNSVIQSAVVAATLDLPIDQNLGFAYIVPYNQSTNSNGKWTKVKKGQFQLGYKGYIQLALRSGQYKTINATEIYEGELINSNRLTGEVQFNSDSSTVNYDKVIGYAAYFKLLNGFEKVLYMSTEQVKKHAEKYSSSYAYDLKKSEDKRTSLWHTDFDMMAQKTVLKLLISKFGPLSTKMQEAIINDNRDNYFDNKVDEEIKENANTTVIDIEEDDIQEVIEAEETKEEPKEEVKEEVKEVIEPKIETVEDVDIPF